MAKDEDIVDAEIVEVPEIPTVAQAEEAAKPKMTKEEMIAAGLLPPQKSKVAQAVQSETRKVAQSADRQVPKHANTVDNVSAVKKAETRGGMAHEIIKAMFQGMGGRDMDEVDVDAVVQFAFKLADGIQAETDRGYRQDLVDATSQQLRTS